MKFERTKLKVDVYGESVEFDSPSVAKIQIISSLQGDFNSGVITSEDLFNKIVSFLVSLGFSENTIRDMEVEHLNELVEFVVSKKKKVEKSDP